MLLLLQSYITYQQFPRTGGEILTPVWVEESNNDDDLLLLWFALMRNYYEQKQD